eukprot:TRINITY_DN387_c0_g4_i1.p1 TRINITY_DN387_c0_g4~~TRINITY_DN387_c0_g4_i1.p1  ORF type:complete len:306 (-),score=52.51 TRINITY_DN387_c0_g4_i1:55-972(-)
MEMPTCESAMELEATPYHSPFLDSSPCRRRPPSPSPSPSLSPPDFTSFTSAPSLAPFPSFPRTHGFPHPDRPPHSPSKCSTGPLPRSLLASLNTDLSSLLLSPSLSKSTSPQKRGLVLACDAPQSLRPSKRPRIDIEPLPPLLPCPSLRSATSLPSLSPSSPSPTPPTTPKKEKCVPFHESPSSATYLAAREGTLKRRAGAPPEFRSPRMKHQRTLRQGIMVREGLLEKPSPLWTSCFLRVPEDQFIPCKILGKEPQAWLVVLKENSLGEHEGVVYKKGERYWVKWSRQVSADAGLPIVTAIHSA